MGIHPFSFFLIIKIMRRLLFGTIAVSTSYAIKLLLILNGLVVNHANEF